MTNKPQTLRMKYECETGKEAGPLRRLGYAFIEHPLKTTNILVWGGLAGVFAGVAAVSTLKTYLSPFAPDAIVGMSVFGKEPTSPNRGSYDEYLLDKLLEEPHLAYEAFEKLYGIKNNGNDKEIAEKFYKIWENRETWVGPTGKDFMGLVRSKPDYNQAPDADDINNKYSYPVAIALTGFISKRAYGVAADHPIQMEIIRLEGETAKSEAEIARINRLAAEAPAPDLSILLKSNQHPPQKRTEREDIIDYMMKMQRAASAPSSP